MTGFVNYYKEQNIFINLTSIPIPSIKCLQNKEAYKKWSSK